MSSEDDRSQPSKTAKGTLYLVIKAMGTGISGSLFFIFIARTLPNVSDLGFVQSLQTLIMITSVLSGLGLSRGAMRFIPSYIGDGREEMAQRVYISVYRMGLISSSLWSFAIYITATYIATIFFHDAIYTHLIQLAAVDIFLQSMIVFSISLFYASQDFRKVFTISAVNLPLKYGIASTLLLLGMGLDGIVIGLIIGDAISFLIYVYFLMPKIRGRAAHKLGALFSYSLPIYVYNVLDYSSRELDVYVLLILSNLSVVGIYSPAVMVGTMLFFILGSIDQSLTPYFSRIHGRSGFESLVASSKSVSRYVLLIFLPIGFATLASSPLLIPGIFGHRYSDAVYPAMIIIGAITLSSMISVFNNILMSAGRNRIFLVAGSAALSVQLTISISTIPILGVMGAAIARASSYVILFLIPAFMLKRIGGIQYDRDALRNGLIGSLLMGSIILILDFYLASPFYLPLTLIVGVLVYMLFLRFTSSIDEKDIQIVNSILSHRLRWVSTLLSKILIR